MSLFWIVIRQLAEIEAMAMSKKVITREEWEKKLNDVKIRKEDMNKLVMNFLVTEGYVDAAEKFRMESGTEHIDLATITDRMAVKKAVQCGNVEDAIEKVNDLNPEILDTNPQLFFHLQQQRLIELIRNGKVEEALEFAQEELAPRGEENQSFLEELERTVALLAFEDVSNCPVGDLLDISQRLKTVFLSPLSLPHHFTNSTPKFLKTYTKPTLIVCKSTLSPETQFESDGAGAGAAAPTHGDRFLELQKAKEAAKVVLRDSKKKRKKKDKVLKVNTAVASCYGCGAPLQTSESDAPGYVDPDTYELKKKHHQLKTVLCGRCRLLSHGHMITAVGGNGGYAGGKQFVSADELREKLSHLRREKALIVKLVDIVDFNGSFLARIRDLAGANPIILVVTKVDLLPKGTDFNCVGDWVVEATTKKKLNVLSVHLTSSKSLAGIVGVASEIQKEKKGRDVYILGSANVGKSAFINALLKKMGERDPAAAMAQKYRPIQSAVPGTTLGPIQIDAFLGGGKLYDTPGVHLHHRQAAVVHAEDLPALAPQSRLRGQSFAVIAETETNNEFKSHGLNGFTIFWGGLVRIDLLKVLPETCLTFYGPKSLQVYMVPTDKADEFYQKELGVMLTPPIGKQKAEGWKGLDTERLLEIKFEDTERPASDVAISGLGWISVEPVRRSIRSSDINLESTSGELHLAVHVPKPVEVFVRSPMPVGKAGAEWYQYRELTEKELEVRPKWYF